MRINGTCRDCGDKIEDATAEHDTCYACHLDGLTPARYERREEYQWCRVDGIAKAATRPATGKVILDAPPPPRCSDVAQTAGQAFLVHMAEVEAGQGLEHDYGK